MNTHDHIAAREARVAKQRAALTAKQRMEAKRMTLLADPDYRALVDKWQTAETAAAQALIKELADRKGNV